MLLFGLGNDTQNSTFSYNNLYAHLLASTEKWNTCSWTQQQRNGWMIFLSSWWSSSSSPGKSSLRFPYIAPSHHRFTLKWLNNLPHRIMLFFRALSTAARMQSCIYAWRYICIHRERNRLSLFSISLVWASISCVWSIVYIYLLDNRFRLEKSFPIELLVFSLFLFCYFIIIFFLFSKH